VSSEDDLNEIIARTTAAVNSLVSGDAGPFNELYLHEKDVTVFGVLARTNSAGIPLEKT
jgi:hypothetical protein